MGYARKDVEKTKKLAKKFVRYQEGAELYSIGLTKFQELAKEAKAVYKIDKVALVNCEIFEKYLETFRIAQRREEKSRGFGSNHSAYCNKSATIFVFIVQNNCTFKDTFNKTKVSFFSLQFYFLY